MPISEEHLKSLTDDKLAQRLFAGQAARHYAAGHVLFRMEERAEFVFLLLNGQVEISYLSPAGQRMIANFAAPGQLIGEIAALDGGRRTASAICVSNCEMMALPRRTVLDELERDGELAMIMIGRLCTRLREMHQSIAGHTMLTLRARLAMRLLHLSKQSQDRHGWVKISQSGLADYTSATRESINKLIGEFRKKGYIETRRGAYRLLQTEPFLELAEEESGVL